MAGPVNGLPSSTPTGNAPTVCPEHDCEVSGICVHLLKPVISDAPVQTELGSKRYTQRDTWGKWEGGQQTKKVSHNRGQRPRTSKPLC